MVDTAGNKRKASEIILLSKPIKDKFSQTNSWVFNDLA